MPRSGMSNNLHIALYMSEQWNTLLPASRHTHAHALATRTGGQIKRGPRTRIFCATAPQKTTSNHLLKKIAPYFHLITALGQYCEPRRRPVCADVAPQPALQIMRYSPTTMLLPCLCSHARVMRRMRTARACQRQRLLNRQGVLCWQAPSATHRAGAWLMSS